MIGAADDAKKNPGYSPGFLLPADRIGAGDVARA